MGSFCTSHAAAANKRVVVEGKELSPTKSPKNNLVCGGDSNSGIKLPLGEVEKDIPLGTKDNLKEKLFSSTSSSKC